MGPYPPGHLFYIYLITIKSTSIARFYLYQSYISQLKICRLRY